MSDQKICPTCGTEYPLSERFCPRDGTALRSASASADLMGTVVADRYHILKKLGEGGMGQVYLAEHVKMGRKSALKVMNPGMNQDADAIARFNREASNASRLNHPNICAIYDFGETPDGLIYLAMEFIEGQSLTALVESCGALPAARGAAIIHQSADALQVAHDAGIVHRDLKPDNIMIAKNRDGSDLAKVVDFGIAKAHSSDAQKVTKTGMVVGTPEYMSPEQLSGDKLDGRSDIYSLGLVAFNCLTGKLPFPAETAQEAMIARLIELPKTLAEMKPDVAWTDEVQRVMSKALERDAAERYQSAAQFGRELWAACESMPSSQAAAAGTQVLSAPASTAANVPKTRVATPSEGGKTVAAPAAPVTAGSAPVAAKKSNMGMIAAAVIGITVLAGGGYVMLRPSSPPIAPAADGAAAVPQGAAAQQAATPTTTAPNAAPGGAGKTELLKTSVNPAGAGTRMPEVPAPKAGAPAVTNANPASKWIQIAASGQMTAGEARAALGELQGVAPGLVGDAQKQAYFVIGVSVYAQDEENSKEYCAILRRAEGLSEKKAQTMLKGILSANCSQ